MSLAEISQIDPAAVKGGMRVPMAGSMPQQHARHHLKLNT